MVVNLNKKIVTKEGLLSHITDWDIYTRYIGPEIAIKKSMNSPLSDDNVASFGLYTSGGEIMFKDFRLGSGDCIKFVQMKYGLDFNEALSKIAIDFCLEKHFHIKNTFRTNEHTSSVTKTRQTIVKNLNTYKLGKKSRPWELYDLTFWNQFGITYNTLIKYNVQPIEYIIIGDNIIKADKFAYCFSEFKDGKETYKFYQPYNKIYKWLNNHDSSVWQGWEQLPNKKNIREYDGDNIIITKSLKDVMAIHDVIGIPVVSLQNEGLMPKEHIVQQLKDRFKNVFVLYDNDFDKDVNWGRKFGEDLSNRFDLFQIEIDEAFKSKDFSELVANFGEDIAREVILELIKLPF